MDWVRRSFRLGGRKPGCTHVDDPCALQHVQNALGGPGGRGPLLEILCRPAIAAANAQAVRIRIRTARSGRGATGNTCATLATARGSRLGKEAVRDGGEIVVFLSHRQTPEPSSLD